MSNEDKVLDSFFSQKDPDLSMVELREAGDSLEKQGFLKVIMTGGVVEFEPTALLLKIQSHLTSSIESRN